MLAKVVAHDQRDWCEHLPMVMAAYRSSVHSSTVFSPNFLVFGREVNAPIDLMLSRPYDPQYDSVDEYVQRKLDILESAHQLARENLHASSTRSKNHYDVKVRSKSITVGDWVWYYSPRRYVGRSPKLQ